MLFCNRYVGVHVTKHGLQKDRVICQAMAMHHVMVKYAAAAGAGACCDLLEPCIMMRT